MYKFCTLFSGSSGNATYIGDNNSGILVDIGKNAKQTTTSLGEIGIDPTAVKAIFVTHEHIDHVAGLRVFCNKYKIPVYASLGTLNALESAGHLKGDFPVFQMTETADVGDFHVKCFHTSHDSAESFGYSVTLPDGKRASVSTDLGIVTDEVRSNILGSDIILLESNHSVEMLSNGPYPYYLKRRILSEHGHLSNDAAATEAVNLLQSGTKQIYLGHLSHENNTPDVAYQTTHASLQMAGAADADISLGVASRYKPCVSEVF